MSLHIVEGFLVVDECGSGISYSVHLSFSWFVEQISIPLAPVFNLSLEEGVVRLEQRKANIMTLFKNWFEKQVREV